MKIIQNKTALIIIIGTIFFLFLTSCKNEVSELSSIEKETAKKEISARINEIVEGAKQFNIEMAMNPYLDLENVIITGFSAGALIDTNVGLSQNNPKYPNKLDQGIRIKGVLNFTGGVDELDLVEKTFIDNEVEAYSILGKALFSSEGYEQKDIIAIYEPTTYFDEKNPPLFLWQGGMDDQILQKPIPLLFRF